MIRTVVADAGPLIGLSRIGALHLLAELFGRVVLTETVRAELGFPPAAPNTLPSPARQALPVPTRQRPAPIPKLGSPQVLLP